jgi:two-component system LytT family response regulator
MERNAVQAVPRLLHFPAVAGSLTLLAAGACLVHGVAIDAEIDLPHTLAWAIKSTLPWVCAWEGLKRVSALLLRPSQPARRAAESATDRLRRLQLQRVLDVPTRCGVLALPACDIEYIKAAGNYVELITGDRTLLMRTTLQDLGHQLGAAGFVRVHRSLLVNPLHVVATRRGPRGRRLVALRSGAQLPVGRQFDENTAAFVTTAPRSSQRD